MDFRNYWERDSLYLRCEGSLAGVLAEAAPAAGHLHGLELLLQLHRDVPRFLLALLGLLHLRVLLEVLFRGSCKVLGYYFGLWEL